MPLTSFAGESGLIAFVTTTEEKNYSHWECFPQAPPSYLTSLNLFFTGKNFIIFP